MPDFVDPPHGGLTLFEEWIRVERGKERGVEGGEEVGTVCKMKKICLKRARRVASLGLEDLMLLVYPYYPRQSTHLVQPHQNNSGILHRIKKDSPNISFKIFYLIFTCEYILIKPTLLQFFSYAPSLFLPTPRALSHPLLPSLSLSPLPSSNIH